MAPIKFNSIKSLEENPKDLFMDSIEILIRIARNILKEPSNPKFRSISLKSNVVTKKLLPACGAIECLFEMGFQEGDDSLILSQEKSLDSIKCIYNELVKKWERQKNSNTVLIEEKTSKRDCDEVSLIKRDLIVLQKQTTNQFLKKIIFWCFYILRYENYKLQKKALNLIPLFELHLNVMKNIRRIQLEYKMNKGSMEDSIDYQELLLRELCNWFNTEFFTWVDTPQCTKCGFIETVHEGMSSETVDGADRVERYRCKKCNEVVLFPRYNDPSMLLETRKGRCGEWANCFCLFCRAMGWDSRLVFDETDHVWTEIFSILKGRWIHCDPCENAVDTPLMYECGWKKKLSYIIAYSKDEIQDVTWRYSRNHKKILENRKKCSEEMLVDFIVRTRNLLLSHVTPSRKKFVTFRTALELVELMTENSSTATEEKGRISGSLNWRLLRGETCGDDLNFRPYTWKIDETDKVNKKFELSYITSKDTYFKNSECVMKHWKSGLYKAQSVFKKDEKDWKVTYLAREEGAEKGFICWRFEAADDFSIGNIHLKLIRQTYETGVVSVKICSPDFCISIPNDREKFSTNAFTYSKSIELVVELFGGEFWQHSQVLRQSFTSEDPTFHIIIDLIESI